MTGPPKADKTALTMVKTSAVLLALALARASEQEWEKKKVAGYIQ